MKPLLFFLCVSLLAVSCERKQETPASVSNTPAPPKEDPRLQYRQLADQTFKTASTFYQTSEAWHDLDTERRVNKISHTEWGQTKYAEFHSLTVDAQGAIKEAAAHAETLRNLPAPATELTEIHSLIVDMNLALNEMTSIVIVERKTQTIFCRGDRSAISLPGSRLVKAYERIDLLLPK